MRNETSNQEVEKGEDVLRCKVEEDTSPLMPQLLPAALGHGNSSSDLYAEKLAIDSRSHARRGGNGRPKASSSPTKANNNNNTVYERKLAVDARSRQVRGKAKSPGPVVAVGAEATSGSIVDQKTRIHDRSQQKQKRYQQQTNNETIKTESVGRNNIAHATGPTWIPANININTSQQQRQGEDVVANAPATTVQDQPEPDIELNAMEEEPSDPNGNLIEAYTVEETTDQSVLFAEPVDETKTRRQMAMGGIIFCLVVIGVALGVAIPLSTRVVPATEAPTVSPSEMPSFAPTASPVPSSVPSMAPTMAPTADFCSMSMNVTCTEPITGQSCSKYSELLLTKFDEDAAIATGQCNSDPVAVEGYYIGKGGACYDDCTDYNGGLPSFGTSRVRISSTWTPGLVYYDNLVDIGESFILEHPNLDPIQDELNITIFTPNGTLLQTTTFLLDCKSRYLYAVPGGLVFTGFSSIEEGNKSAGFGGQTDFTARFALEVRNEGVAPLRLDTFTASIDRSDVEGHTDFPVRTVDFFKDTLPDAGIIDVGGNLTRYILANHYSTLDADYLFLVTASGRNLAGTECELYNQVYPFTINSTYEFWPLNASQTSQDTSHLQHPNATCETKGSIHCVGRTVHGQVDCDDALRFPGLYPSEIQFVVDGGDCSPMEAHTCKDSFGGPSDSDQDFFVQVQMQDKTLLERVVNRNETLKLGSKYGLGPYLDIVILTSTPDRSVLQRQRIWTSDYDTFLVGEHFGALKLANVTASITSRPLASIILRLKITNQGLVGSTISSAIIGGLTEETSLALTDASNSVVLTNATDLGFFALVNDSNAVWINPQEDIYLNFIAVRVDDWLSRYNSSRLSWSASIAGVSNNGRPCEDVANANFMDLMSAKA